MRREIIVSSFALILLAPSRASAQAPQSFADLALRINLDDQVRIVDQSGIKASGRLTRLTREDIEIHDDAGEKRFTSETVGEVAVKRHPLGKGALIGAGVFAVLGAVACFQPEEDSSAVCFLARPLAAAPIGAGVGVAVGALISQMSTIYRAPAQGVPAPQPRGGTGVQASLLEDLALRVNLDDRLRIEDRSGVRTTGRLTRLTDDAITIQGSAGEQQFTRATIRQVETRRRPIRLATLIGAGAGAGLAVGALVHKTTIVYPEPETRTVVSPAISRVGAGVQVSVIW